MRDRSTAEAPACPVRKLTETHSLTHDSHLRKDALFLTPSRRLRVAIGGLAAGLRRPCSRARYRPRSLPHGRAQHGPVSSIWCRKGLQDKPLKRQRPSALSLSFSLSLYTHTHTHTRIQTHTHTHIHIHTHTHTHTYTRAHTYTRTHVNTHTCIHTHTHTHTHTTHAHTHTYTYTNTHTHTHTLSLSLLHAHDIPQRGAQGTATALSGQASAARACQCLQPRQLALDPSRTGTSRSKLR